MCKELASRKLACISAEYTLGRSRLVLAEAKAVVNWVRAHAAALGIAPDRVAVGGGSVGGYLAASTAVIPDNDPESSMPNALILLNPVLGLYNGGPPEILAKHLTRPLPPTLIVHGTADSVVPVSVVQSFVAEARAAGSTRIELILYPNRKHGFWNGTADTNPDFPAVSHQISDFLNSMH